MCFKAKGIIEILLLLVFLILTVNAQKINRYELNVNMDVHSKKIVVDGSIDVFFEGIDSISLVLWKHTKINSIGCQDIKVNYRFDTSSKSPIMYIPQGRLLHVSKNLGSSDTQKIYLNYECDFNSLTGWAKVFTSDWIEINYYSAWFPLNSNSRTFTSKLNINIDDEYKVTGSGIIKKNKNSWVIEQPWSSFDNVIIAAPNLKLKTLSSESAYIETDYTDFTESGVDSVINECKYAFDLYSKYFGNIDSAYLKIVMVPYERRGGYSRKKFVALGAKKFSDYVIRGIGHELAHLWWLNAETTSYEDWLNEAFAEYSMLFYIRHRLGEKEFSKRVAYYKENTKKSKPIIGIKRDSPDAYVSLYEKGALILIELEEKIGESRFFEFMRLVYERKIRNTLEMFNFIEIYYSIELRKWLESKLS